MRLKIRAFVGHSFLERDLEVVRAILECLDTVKTAIPEFSWDHAKAAEPKDLREKVLEKIKDKNLFIGICTAKEYVISPAQLKRFPLSNVLFTRRSDVETKTSDWIIQEIGLAVGRSIPLILLVEEGLRVPGGLQGNIEYIPFSRKSPRDALPKLIQMVRAIAPALPPEGHGLAISQPEPTEENKSRDKKQVELEVTPGDDWTEKDYFRAIFDAIVFDLPTKEEEILTAFDRSSYGKKADARVSFRAKRFHLLHLIQRKDIASDLRTLISENPENLTAQDRLARVYQDQGQLEAASVIFETLAAQASKNEEKIKYRGLVAELAATIGDHTHANKQFSALEALYAGRKPGA